jgi:hypothetical protein
MSYSSSREAGFSPGAGGILSQRLPGAVVVHVSTFPSVLGHWEISAESYAADGRCAQIPVIRRRPGHQRESLGRGGRVLRSGPATAPSQAARPICARCAIPRGRTGARAGKQSRKHARHNMPAATLGDQHSLMRTALEVIGGRETVAVFAEDGVGSEGHCCAASRLYATTWPVI